MEVLTMRRNYRRRYGVRGTEDIIVLLILAVIAMPVAGAWMLITGKDSTRKILGAGLLILGIIFWLFLGSN